MFYLIGIYMSRYTCDLSIFVSSRFPSLKRLDELAQKFKFGLSLVRSLQKCISEVFSNAFFFFATNEATIYHE